MPALPLIVLDVNETLVDLRTMEPTFKRVFGDKADMQLWFANLVMYSLALTLADSYVPFTDIGSAVMKMLADTQGIDINDADRRELKEKFSTMPPYLEVPGALQKVVGKRLSPAVLFDHETIDDLAEYLAGELQLPGRTGGLDPVP